LINKYILECKKRTSFSDRILCLRELYYETHDGNVACALAVELESQGNLEEALKYYRVAMKRYPKAEYKLKAQRSFERLERQIATQRRELSKICSEEKSTIEDLYLLDPRTTLFVVTCTKDKIWSQKRNVDEYVPAISAYTGKTVTNFLKFLKEKRLEEKGFKWIILSAKYGYVEPSHPIRNYNVTFNDVATGPISDDSLYAQVMYQKRWGNVSLRNFKKVIVYRGKTYIEKVRKSFKDTEAQIIDGTKLVEGLKDTDMQYPRLEHLTSKAKGNHFKELFEVFWKKLTNILREERLIRNWTVDSGFIGRGDFKAVYRIGNYILCYPPNALNVQKVPKRDFKLMFENWQDYIHHRISRADLRNKSRFTKYTISILYQYRELLE